MACIAMLYVYQEDMNRQTGKHNVNLHSLAINLLTNIIFGIENMKKSDFSGSVVISYSLTNVLNKHILFDNLFLSLSLLAHLNFIGNVRLAFRLLYFQNKEIGSDYFRRGPT